MPHSTPRYQQLLSWLQINLPFAHHAFLIALCMHWLAHSPVWQRISIFSAIVYFWGIIAFTCVLGNWQLLARQRHDHPNHALMLTHSAGFLCVWLSAFLALLIPYAPIWIANAMLLAIPAILIGIGLSLLQYSTRDHHLDTTKPLSCVAPLSGTMMGLLLLYGLQTFILPNQSWQGIWGLIVLGASLALHTIYITATEPAKPHRTHWSSDDTRWLSHPNSAKVLQINYMVCVIELTALGLYAWHAHLFFALAAVMACILGLFSWQPPNISTSFSSLVGLYLAKMLTVACIIALMHRPSSWWLVLCFLSSFISTRLCLSSAYRYCFCLKHPPFMTALSSSITAPSLWLGFTFYDAVTTHPLYSLIALVFVYTALLYAHRRMMHIGFIAEGFRATIAMILRFLFGLKIHGLEHLFVSTDGGIITTSNHVSLFDTLIIGSSFTMPMLYPISPLWINKWYVRAINSVFGLVFPVDPKDARSLIALIKLIRSGKRCMIFPEAGLSRTGNLMRIHEGTATMIDQSGCKVQAFIINGAHQMPLSLEDFRSNVSWRAPIRLGVSKPQRFETGALKGKEKRSYLTHLVWKNMLNTHLASYDQTHDLFDALQLAKIRYRPKQPLLRDHDWEADRSYATLIHQVIVFSKSLQTLCPPHSLVIVYLPHNCMHISVLFAIFHAARVALSLQVTDTHAALTTACARVQAKLIITDHAHQQAVRTMVQGSSQASIVTVEELAERPPTRTWFSASHDQTTSAQHTPAVAYFLDDATLSVYTHRQILDHCYQLGLMSSLEGRDIVYHAAGLDQHFGLCTALCALLHGVPMYIETMPLSAKDRLFRLEESNASTLFATTSVLYEQANTLSLPAIFKLHTVFTLQTTTHPLKQDLCETWRKKANSYVFSCFSLQNNTPVLAMMTPYFDIDQQLGFLLPGTLINQTHDSPAPYAMRIESFSGPQCAYTHWQMVDGICQADTLSPQRLRFASVHPTDTLYALHTGKISNLLSHEHNHVTD